MVQLKKRKAKGLFIVFWSQKAPVSLWEWAESLPTPPKEQAISVLACSAWAASFCERCGWQQGMLQHTESWMNSFSLNRQALSWSQSLRLAADPLVAGDASGNLTHPGKKVRPTFY